MARGINLLYIDLFCGAGGVTEGISRNPQAKVIACVNHDKNAIASHKANHSESHHFIEDIRTLNLTELISITNKARIDHPNAKVVLWASLECTHFSSAKGGQKRDPDSRTLAEHLLRYIDKLDPDYVQIENVREFMTWGKLLPNGKPDPDDKGRLYSLWVYNIAKRGYNYDFQLINSADLGAYTARLRYFGTFAKKGLPIIWPEANKKGKPVRDVLDLYDIGEDIFKRSKPLVEKTLERIYNGLVKMADEYGVMSYYGNGNVVGIDKPAPTVTTKDRLALVTSKKVSHWLINPQYQSKGRSIDKPCFTLIARMDKAPPYLMSAVHGELPEVTGTPWEKKLKLLMHELHIESIHLRMFKVPELKRIMGFGDDYKLIGTQTEQKKFIGNAVEVNTAAAISLALSDAINNQLTVTEENYGSWGEQGHFTWTFG